MDLIKVKHPHESGDSMLINEADFDARVHQRYEDAPKGAKADDAPVGDKPKGKKGAKADDAPVGE